MAVISYKWVFSSIASAACQNKVRGGNMTGAIILSCRKLSHNIYLGISPESELPKVSTDIFNVLTTYK